jgi:hypothetical protein
VQQATGDHLAAAASQQQALKLFGDLGDQLGQAEALNRLGELATRTSATGQACARHAQAWPSPATSARPERKQALWKGSARPTCKTATPAMPPGTCGRHSRSTSASAPPPRCVNVTGIRGTMGIGLESLRGLTVPTLMIWGILVSLPHAEGPVQCLDQPVSRQA